MLHINYNNNFKTPFEFFWYYHICVKLHYAKVHIIGDVMPKL